LVVLVVSAGNNAVGSQLEVPKRDGPVLDVDRLGKMLRGLVDVADLSDLRIQSYSGYFRHTVDLGGRRRKSFE